MNASPASSCSPHLGLDDLAAEANGRPISDRAQEHLAACGICRAEANRWTVVAGGVRSLVAAAPPVAQPAPPRPGRAHEPAGRGRRTRLAAGVAAALALIGSAGYGANAALTGHRPAARTTGTAAAALTSVKGCTSLKQADGKLLHVRRSSLTIKTATGQRVTVKTTAATKVSLLGLPLSYITNGTRVMAVGPKSGRTIRARHVNIRPAFIGKGELTLPPGFAAARGTVTHARATGFILVTARGARIPVSTSRRTEVDITPPHATLSELRIGVATIAVGQAGRHGTLSAMGVLQQPGYHGTITVNGCTPGSINDAITTALVSGG